MVKKCISKYTFYALKIKNVALFHKLLNYRPFYVYKRLHYNTVVTINWILVITISDLNKMLL